MGQIEDALNLAHAANRISSRINSDWMKAYVLNLYGEVQRMQGDFKTADESYRTGEILLRKQGDQGGELPRIIHSQGYTNLHLDDLITAEEKFRKSLDIFHKIGSRRGIAECLAGIAILHARQGSYHQSIVLLSAATTLMKQFGGKWWPTDKIEVKASLGKLRSALSTAEFQTAWEEGQEIDLDTAIELTKSRLLV
jgi:tetratricopeptide (TPR) repeat protein